MPNVNLERIKAGFSDPMDQVMAEGLVMAPLSGKADVLRQSRPSLVRYFAEFSAGAFEGEGQSD